MPSSFVGGVVGRGVVWGRRNSLDPVQWRATMTVRGSQHSTFEERLGKLRLFRLGRWGSEGMYMLSTAVGYRGDRARLFSGVHNKGTRGNGYKFTAVRNMGNISPWEWSDTAKKAHEIPSLASIQNSCGQGHEQPSYTLNLVLFE